MFKNGSSNFALDTPHIFFSGEIVQLTAKFTNFVCQFVYSIYNPFIANIYVFSS